MTQECLALVSILLRTVHEDRGVEFGNARLVRNIFERMINRHSHRLSTVDNVSDVEITTFQVDDVPIREFTRFRPGEINLEVVTWTAACPSCGENLKGHVADISREVRCKCGCKFLFRCVHLSDQSFTEIQSSLT